MIFDGMAMGASNATAFGEASVADGSSAPIRGRKLA
jgi:hypothetical protein